MSNGENENEELVHAQERESIRAQEIESVHTQERESIHAQEHESIHAQEHESIHAQERERNILEALLKKGPALPVELAARTYSFPEEIAEPLSKLEQDGLVERQPLKAGEMIVLTEKGQKQMKHGG